MRLTVVALLSICCAAPLLSKEDENAAQKAELKKKIAEYQKKSGKVLEKISATRNEMSAEQGVHERYTENFTSERERLEKEKNGLKSELRSLAKSSDSLSRRIASVGARTDELNLVEKRYQASLLKVIDTYSAAVSEIPAPILTKEGESLAFLKTELQSGAISSVEATERLWQVISTVNKNRLSIDVWSGISSWEEITGKSHFLRVGYGYVATINDESTKGAVWDGLKWNSLTSPADLMALRTAVRIRNGNSLPDIVSLPLPEVVTAVEVNDE